MPPCFQRQGRGRLLNTLKIFVGCDDHEVKSLGNRCVLRVIFSDARLSGGCATSLGLLSRAEAIQDSRLDPPVEIGSFAVDLVDANALQKTMELMTILFALL